jgi:hypothetical protein
MTTSTKDYVRTLARRVVADPTAPNDKKILAKAVLSLMGERIK